MTQQAKADALQANARFTPEHHKEMREMGYVAYREANGRILFVCRDIYADLVKARQLVPSSSVQ